MQAFNPRVATFISFSLFLELPSSVFPLSYGGGGGVGLLQHPHDVQRDKKKKKTLSLSLSFSAPFRKTQKDKAFKDRPSL